MLIAVAGIGFLAFEKVKDHFQAPIIKERDAALETAKANADALQALKKDQEQKEQATKKLADQKDQIKREKDRLANELETLKRNDKAVRDWADVLLPAAIDERLRAISQAGDQSRNGLPETRLKLDTTNHNPRTP